MPTLEIDGQQVEVPDGTTILEAAKKIGRHVPYYCYHEKLSAPANCRQCLVEVAKAPKLLPSCYTRVSEGMQVQTDSPAVREFQRRNMELLLLNHPVDCPICDQAGECKLQDYYQRHDYKPSRLNVLPVHKPKVIRLGAQVVLDAERCILCTRCIRFFEEVVDERPLGTFKRGNKTELGLYPGKELPYGYARNVVDICPVGALTSEDFRFNKRVWFLARTPSVCTGCARGCNIYVHHDEGKVYRYHPRPNDDVNQCWLCDDGAYSYHEVNEGRVLGPRMLKDGALTDVLWDDALGAAADLLQRSNLPVGIVLSAQATCEDNWAFVRLGREALSGARFYVCGKGAGEADNFLKVADRNPNTAGARLVAGETGDAAALRADLAAGRIDTVLLVGGDLPDEETVSALASAENVILVTTRETPALSAAAVVLAACSAAEKDGGTFVNFEGRAQRLSHADAPTFIDFHQRQREVSPPMKPMGRSGPEWKIALRLGTKLGLDLGWDGIGAITAELAEAIPAFPEAIGPCGTVIPGQ